MIHLTRGLALQKFDLQVETQGTPLHVGGRTDGDSAVVFSLRSGPTPPDSQRIAVRGPILLPTLVPLVIALGETPKVGKSYRVPTFDPQAMLSRDLAIAVRAESLFTLVDSATYDEGRAEWVAAHADTTRAWRLEPTNGSGFTNSAYWSRSRSACERLSSSIGLVLNWSQKAVPLSIAVIFVSSPPWL